MIETRTQGQGAKHGRTLLRRPFPRMLRWPALACVALGVMLAPVHGIAAGIPFNDKPVSISARGQDVRDFVADLFSQSGLRAKVSSAAKGKVQGVFRGSPGEIWSTISRAYGLTAYWDGSVVRIYSNSEVTSRSVSTAAAAKVVSETQRLGLTDNINQARASGNMVMATGVPVFLDRVEDIAGQMRAPALAAASPSPAPVTPVIQNTGFTPGTTAFASPLMRAPLARASVRSEIIRSAGRRNPFEVRMFFLKYRDAADREARSSDRVTVVPGVATLLLEQMGDGSQVGAVSSNSSNEYSSNGMTRLGMSRMRNAQITGDETDHDDAGGSAATGLDGPRISADPTVNAVIVRDRPEAMPVYEKLIANLDIEPLMVETQVTILELNTTKLKELGLDFGFGIQSLGVLFGGGLNLGPGGITGGYLSGDGDIFLARIKALEKRGALRVVTRPVLSSANNQVASFDITTQQVVKLEGEREVDAFAVNYGLAMRVRPSAIEDGGDMRIRLQIEISDTQLNGGVVDGVPTATGPRIATQTIVKQGESVMLAGMSSDRTYDYKQKTPILGDIPILGQAFRKRSKSEDHFEKLFLLTPRISNLGTPQVAIGEVVPLTLEQLSGEAPVRGKNR